MRAKYELRNFMNHYGLTAEEIYELAQEVEKEEKEIEKDEEQEA